MSHCDNCAPEFSECWNDGTQCRKQPRNLLPEQVRAAIDTEPELPCEMPKEIWDMLRSDERAAAEVMRANVRAMKRNIKARLGL